MSLSIDDRTVVGVFDLNQWFEIFPNSIRVDAYEFMYFDDVIPFGEELQNQTCLKCYFMGDMYEKRQESEESKKVRIRLNSSNDITFLSPDPYAGFEFKCSKTGDTIAFPITEIKAFKYKPELNTVNS